MTCFESRSLLAGPAGYHFTDTCESRHFTWHLTFRLLWHCTFHLKLEQRCTLHWMSCNVKSSVESPEAFNFGLTVDFWELAADNTLKSSLGRVHLGYAVSAVSTHRELWAWELVVLISADQGSNWLLKLHISQLLGKFSQIQLFHWGQVGKRLQLWKVGWLREKEKKLLHNYLI